ncbi:MAG: hypothetical protein KDA45_17225, partial [Planctomycetales bacterium]|nr:hypothetical protein [Planctomycetales bacterium]
MIPLARGSQLLVVETAGKMKTINELIAAVPLPKPAPKPDKPAPPPKPVFAAYPLGDLESAAVLTTIRKLIPSEQITVDAKTSVLSAFVIPDQQAAIKSAIEQMQASQAELPAAESIAYRFSGIKAEELQKQIASLAPRATVTATADRVLVTAEASEQQLIRTALQALDVEPLSVDKSLRVFEVTPSYSEPVGNALRSFLPNSYVAVNAQVGSVLVRGSAEDLQLAAEIIEIWQQSQATDGLNLRAFALDRPAGSEWLATVQQIIPEAKAWLGDEGRQLLLLGHQQEVAAIERILPQLLSVLPEPDLRQLQIYPLSKNQRARRGSLNQLPQALADIKLVDGQNNEEVLVWASPEQHAAFAELLQQIDQPLTPPTTQSPKSYALQVQDTATVTRLLTAEFPEAQLTLQADGEELTVLA